jgi:ribosome-associated translation inhibitor RaiA
MNVKIDFESIAPTGKLESQIRAEAERLCASFPAVQSCHLKVEERVPRAYERKRFHVGLELRIRGRGLVVNREDEADVLAAVRQAVAAAEQRVRDYGLAR